MKLTPYPHLVKEWHPTKNGDLTPKDVTYGSNKKVWWRWGELNPRPKTFSQEVYMLSTGLLL